MIDINEVLPKIVRSHVFTFKKSEDSPEQKAIVDFTFDGWTVKDLIDRLLISSSPVVTLQATLRKENAIVPKEWKVNKAGTKALAQETPVETILEKAKNDPAFRDLLIAKLLEEMEEK